MHILSLSCRTGSPTTGSTGCRFMCFFSPIRNDPKEKAHKQNVGTHPVPGQSRKFVYVSMFLFPWLWKGSAEFGGGVWEPRPVYWGQVFFLQYSPFRETAVALPLSQTIQSGFLKRALAQTCFRVWYQVGFLRRIFGHSWGLVYGEGGAPGTVPLHNLRVTSHVLHQKVLLGWYRVRLFWIIFGHSWGPWGGARGAPLVRHLCKTQKSLHGRHVWETLIQHPV